VVNEVFGAVASYFVQCTVHSAQCTMYTHTGTEQNMQPQHRKLR